MVDFRTCKKSYRSLLNLFFHLWTLRQLPLPVNFSWEVQSIPVVSLFRSSEKILLSIAAYFPPQNGCCFWCIQVCHQPTKTCAEDGELSLAGLAAVSHEAPCVDNATVMVTALFNYPSSCQLTQLVLRCFQKIANGWGLFVTLWGTAASVFWAQRTDWNVALLVVLCFDDDFRSRCIRSHLSTTFSAFQTKITDDWAKFCIFPPTQGLFQWYGRKVNLTD